MNTARRQILIEVNPAAPGAQRHRVTVPIEGFAVELVIEADTEEAARSLVLPLLERMLKLLDRAEVIDATS